MTKMTKEETNYSRGMIHSHCGKVFTNDKGYCQHFIGSDKAITDGACSEVEGVISRVYWCNQFKKVKK